MRRQSQPLATASPRALARTGKLSSISVWVLGTILGLSFSACIPSFRWKRRRNPANPRKARTYFRVCKSCPFYNYVHVFRLRYPTVIVEKGTTELNFSATSVVWCKAFLVGVVSVRCGLVNGRLVRSKLCPKSVLSMNSDFVVTLRLVNFSKAASSPFRKELVDPGKWDTCLFVKVTVCQWKEVGLSPSPLQK